eukprot:TCONS_00072807-protein
MENNSPTNSVTSASEVPLIRSCKEVEMSDAIYLTSSSYGSLKETMAHGRSGKISICYPNEFHDAARHNRVEDLRRILSAYSGNSHKISSLNKERLSALHYAVRYGHIQCVLDIIQADESSVHRKGKHDVQPIHYAARFYRKTDDADENVIEILLKHGADIDAKDSFHYTPLQYAAVSGNVDALRILLNHFKENIEHADPSGVTALHSTCLKGEVECALLLIQNGAKVFQTDNKKMNAIHYAAKSDSRQILDPLIQLLEHDNNALINGESLSVLLNIANINGETPLHLAILEENLEACKILIAKGADVNLAKLRGLTPLHLACVKDSVEIVKLLVREGARVTGTDEIREIPLHKAARNDKVEIVKFLLETDPSQVNIEDLDKQTPLIESAAKNNFAITELLLSHGAGIEACDKFMKTSLFWAAEKNSLEVFKVLLQHIKDNELDLKELIEQRDTYEHTPLHIAAKGGHTEIVQILVEHGATVSTLNDQERTPLHTAADNGFIDVARVLIKAKPSMIDEQNASGYTAVHLAAKSGKNEMLSFLLENNADNNPQDNHMLTPLALASYEGHKDCVKTLLHYRAAVEARDPNNKTSLFFAAAEGHAEVVKCLLDHGANVTHKDRTGQNLLDVAIKEGKVDVANVLLDRPEWKCVLRNKSFDESGALTSPMGKMIQSMPAMAKKVLDRCMISHENARQVAAERTRSVEITYEFIDDNFADEMLPADKPEHTYFDSVARIANEVLLRSSYSRRRAEEKMRERHNPPLSILCKKEDSDLLNHPVVSTLIEMKWKKFGKPVYYSKFAIFIIFLFFLSGYVLAVTPLLPSRIFPKEGSNTTENCAPHIEKNFKLEDDVINVLFLIMGRYIVLALSCFQLLLEPIQMINRRFSYFCDLTNWLELTMYILALLYTFPNMDEAYLTNCDTVPYKTSLGACAIFLAWCDLLLFIRKFTNVGIYVVMFIDVMKTFLKFSLTFSLFIVAFAMVFHSLIGPHKELFHTIGRSFAKTVAMTIGEFGYEELFYAKETSRLPMITWFLFVLFCIVMTILLMNMLVGLAVDDIQSVLKKAELTRVKMQVELVLDVEKMLPMKFRKKWGQFTTEEFTHYLRTNVYKRRDHKCDHEANDDGDDVIGWEHEEKV